MVGSARRLARGREVARSSPPSLPLPSLKLEFQARCSTLGARCSLDDAVPFIAFVLNCVGLFLFLPVPWIAVYTIYLSYIHLYSILHSSPARSPSVPFCLFLVHVVVAVVLALLALVRIWIGARIDLIGHSCGPSHTLARPFALALTLSRAIDSCSRVLARLVAIPIPPSPDSTSSYPPRAHCTPRDLLPSARAPTPRS